MSRTRIVKGNITKIIGGDYKRYSKDDIENSGSKIIQVGKEGGVSYGEPKKPPIIGKKIISVEWLDADENPISKSTSGVNVSLKVRTANYEEGETICLKIKEIDDKEIQKGKAEIILTGKIIKGGISYLKEEIFLESIIFNETQIK